jgi:hypothetical protein
LMKTEEEEEGYSCWVRFFIIIIIINLF